MSVLRVRSLMRCIASAGLGILIGLGLRGQTNRSQYPPTEKDLTQWMKEADAERYADVLKVLTSDCDFALAEMVSRRFPGYVRSAGMALVARRDLTTSLFGDAYDVVSNAEALLALGGVYADEEILLGRRTLSRSALWSELVLAAAGPEELVRAAQSIADCGNSEDERLRAIAVWASGRALAAGTGVVMVAENKCATSIVRGVADDSAIVRRASLQVCSMLPLGSSLVRLVLGGLVRRGEGREGLQAIRILLEKPEVWARSEDLRLAVASSGQWLASGKLDEQAAAQAFLLRGCEMFPEAVSSAVSEALGRGGDLITMGPFLYALPNLSDVLRNGELTRELRQIVELREDVKGNAEVLLAAGLLAKVGDADLPKMLLERVSAGGSVSLSGAVEVLGLMGRHVTPEVMRVIEEFLTASLLQPEEKAVGLEALFGCVDARSVVWLSAETVGLLGDIADEDRMEDPLVEAARLVLVMRELTEGKAEVAGEQWERGVRALNGELGVGYLTGLGARVMVQMIDRGVANPVWTDVVESALEGVNAMVDIGCESEANELRLLVLKVVADRA